MRLLTALLCVQACWAGYHHAVSITHNHLKVPSTQSSFTVMVCANTITPCDSGAHTNLALPNLKSTGNGGAVTSASGYDIGIFNSSSCATALPYELEYYSPTTGATILHFLAPSLSSSADQIIGYLCFANPAVTTDQSSTSAWDSNFKRVFHVRSADTIGSAGTLKESTSANAACSSSVLETPTAVTGQINGAIQSTTATTSNGFCNASITGLPAGTTSPFTISTWVKPTSFASSGSTSDSALIWWGRTSDHLECYLTILHTNGKVVTGDRDVIGVTSTSAIDDGTWHYVVGTRDASSSNKIYVDGALEATNTQSLNCNADNPCDAMTDQCLGLGDAGNVGVTHFYLFGALDEVRISSSERSADWITTEYNNQSSPHTFYTFGSDTPIAVPVSSTRRTIEFR